MEEKIKVNEEILLYALRYSLNRQTNAPIKVMDAIIHNIDSISVDIINKIIDEINSSKDVGIKLYEETWIGLVRDLHFELRVRELKA